MPANSGTILQSILVRTRSSRMAGLPCKYRSRYPLIISTVTLCVLCWARRSLTEEIPVEDNKKDNSGDIKLSQSNSSVHWNTSKSDDAVADYVRKSLGDTADMMQNFNWLQGDLLSQHNITLCKNIDSPRAKVEETFEWYGVADRPIYVFSAYYDERKSVGGPLIRLMALGLQLRFHKIGAVYCLLNFKGIEHPVSILATYEFIYPSIMWANEYTAHWILCPLPPEVNTHHSQLVSASVLSSPCEPMPAFQIPIHSPNQISSKKDIALCLPALYKGTDWVHIAEWIILHKLLGYSTVFIYIQSTGEKTDEVLRLYETNLDSQIKVKTLPWRMPKVKNNYFGQHASINDCLYRAGLHHHYATICDKDEILLPLNYKTLPEFLVDFEQSNTAAYLFQHIVFDVSKRAFLNESTVKHITAIDIEKYGIDIKDLQLWTLTYQWHMTEPYPSGNVRSKTVYNISRTISADIHCPYKLVPGFVELMVPPADGVLYHYKQQCEDSWLTDVSYEHGSRIRYYQEKLITDMIHLQRKLKQSL